MNNWLKNNWPRVTTLMIAAVLMLWALGCEPKVPSLTEPTHRVTRTGLQAEMETLIMSYERKNAALEQQERLRKLITENALVIATSGQFNPISLLTTLAAFYGVGSAANDTRKVVKNKIAKSKLDRF